MLPFSAPAIRCINSCRCLGLLSLLFVVLLRPVHAAEVTWTGFDNSLWAHDGNWDGGAPGLDDVARIPASTPNTPEIGSINTMELVTAPTICAGVILEAGASITVLRNPGYGALHALYVIGNGDLDADGISDAYERDYSIAEQNFDADGDGIPNFADEDSDNDGLSDACEYRYGPGENNALHPYVPADPLFPVDSDGDTYSDYEECAAGSDPTDRDSVPPGDIALLGFAGLVTIGLALAVAGFMVLRKSSQRVRNSFYALVAVVALATGGYLGRQAIEATSVTVDFDAGDTLHGKSLLAGDSNTILEIKAGENDRAWSGGSTFVSARRTVTATGGTAFLGGMRVNVDIGVLGEGTATAKSDDNEDFHPRRVDGRVEVGTATLEVFQGERLLHTAEAGARSRFYRWLGDVDSDQEPLEFRVLADGQRVIAVFGPPGPDLAVRRGATAHPTILRTGDEVNLQVLVENIGMEAVEATDWDDGLFLSRDDEHDAADLTLQVIGHTGALDADEDYTQDFSATLPDVAPGRYYILGIADINRDASDENRNNNVLAISVQVLDANLAQ